MTAGYHDVDLELDRMNRAREAEASLERYRDQEGEWTGGVRPLHVIETLEDVQSAFLYRETARPNLVCGYCCSSRQARSEREGRDWFRWHKCDGEGWEIT